MWGIDGIVIKFRGDFRRNWDSVTLIKFSSNLESKTQFDPEYALFVRSSMFALLLTVVIILLIHFFRFPIAAPELTNSICLQGDAAKEGGGTLHSVYLGPRNHGIPPICGFRGGS